MAVQLWKGLVFGSRLGEVTGNSFARIWSGGTLVFTPLLVVVRHRRVARLKLTASRRAFYPNGAAVDRCVPSISSHETGWVKSGRANMNADGKLAWAAEG